MIYCRTGLSRRAVLKGILVLPLGTYTGTGRMGYEPAEAPHDATTLRRATEFLWSKQSADGGWHSETYGLLRSGQAYTPFILHTLLQVPGHVCARPPEGVGRALEFIRNRTNDAGVLGMADPEVPEYPNYATAYALRCLVRAGNDRDKGLIARMRSYLISDQFREENGFDRSSPAYGGWGFGGRRPPGSTGHMDIAHTRRVLEALRDVGNDASSVFERARVFLRYVQRHPNDKRPQPAVEHGVANVDRDVPYDGGFYFSPIVLEANKGRTERNNDESSVYYRSYSTATCDGVLALQAAGVPPHDERLQAARRWLERHPRLDYPEGVPTDHPDPWGAAIQFYHFAVRAEACAALDWPGNWRGRLTVLLAQHQRADGSFTNTASHLMKEDDPLLATPLAAIALTSPRR